MLWNDVVSGAGVYLAFRQEEWARLVDGPASCCGVVCHRLQETQVCGVGVSWLSFAVVVDGEAVLDEEESFNLAEEFHWFHCWMGFVGLMGVVG